MNRMLSFILIAALVTLLFAVCAVKPAAPAPAPAAAPAAPAPAAAAPKAEAPEAEAPAPAEEPKAEEPAPAEEEEEEDYTTGDASLDDPRNADGIGERELLVVSFGTSFNDSRRLTVGAIEQTLADMFPDWSVRRAFTSQIIIDRVARRDGEMIDNVHDALERAVANGVKILVVQPTHLMDGYEYTDLRDELAGYADAFEQIALAEPILKTDRDFDMVAEAIVDATAYFDDGETAICFMGHGTEAASNGVYAKMQTILSEAGCENYFVGTVEAEPSVEDVLALVQEGEYKRVLLRPLMIVAGDHANNDMAGDDPDSWKSVFEAEGYEVKCVLEGLGQLPMVRQLLVEHTAEAMAKAGLEVNWG